MVDKDLDKLLRDLKDGLQGISAEIRQMECLFEQALGDIDLMLKDIEEMLHE